MSGYERLLTQELSESAPMVTTNTQLKPQDSGKPESPARVFYSVLISGLLSCVVLYHVLHLTKGYNIDSSPYQVVVQRNLPYQFINRTVLLHKDLISFRRKGEKTTQAIIDQTMRAFEERVTEQAQTGIKDLMIEVAKANAEEAATAEQTNKPSETATKNSIPAKQVQNVKKTLKTTPRPTLGPLQVIVLSGRHGFDRRAVIRDQTWGEGFDLNVHYVVGDKYCPLPANLNQVWTCTPDNQKITQAKKAGIFEPSLLKYRAEEENVQGKLEKEAGITLLDMVDSYRNLTLKVKLGYKYILENYPDARWIAKADDDQFLRFNKMTEYLLNRENHKGDDPINEMIVIGQIRCGSGVMRGGKWAELDYKKGIKNAKYPCFPIGSAGHILSRKAAEYIVDNFDSLHNYQGEDVSIGIWMDRAINEDKLKVKFVKEPLMTNSGVCKDGKQLVVGHNLNAAKMKSCMWKRP